MGKEYRPTNTRIIHLDLASKGLETREAQYLYLLDLQERTDHYEAHEFHAMLCELWNLKAGVTLVHDRYGDLFRFASIYCYAPRKPWIRGYRLNKDQTWSHKLRGLAGDWLWVR